MLAIHRSREQADGVAVELMNIALAQRLLGNTAAARETLDPIFISTPFFRRSTAPRRLTAALVFYWRTAMSLGRGAGRKGAVLLQRLRHRGPDVQTSGANFPRDEFWRESGSRRAACWHLIAMPAIRLKRPIRCGRRYCPGCRRFQNGVAVL